MNSKQISKFILGATIITTSIQFSTAQVLTSEDSLFAGLVASDKSTVISGYGEAKYQNDLTNQIATANLTRVVLFVGHKFTDKISFFSELEIEDAKVEGGKSGGEVAFEQLFLKFDLTKDVYISAGLFTPRIGIINENHLPTTFNGNDRPRVERLVIPATWREIGVSVYGRVNKVQGLNYSLALVNGLNSAAFENGSGIRKGRFEGQDATASNLAITGSLLYYFNNFRFQISGYYGGSAGLSKAEADTLQLNVNTFGTPVMLTEANVQYENNGFEARALFTFVNIADAFEINRAYNNNTPQSMTGGYIEAGYNILKAFNSTTKKNLSCFARYENIYLNKKTPSNGIENSLNKQQYITTGLTYHPIKGAVIKADYQFVQAGKDSTKQSNNYINLGIGYSF